MNPPPESSAPGPATPAGRAVVACAAAAVAVAACGAVAGGLGPSGPGTAPWALASTGMAAALALGRWVFAFGRWSSAPALGRWFRIRPGRAGLWTALCLALLAAGAAGLSRPLGAIAGTVAGILAGLALAEATGQALARAPAVLALSGGRPGWLVFGGLPLVLLVGWSGLVRDPALAGGRALGPLGEPHQCLAAYLRAAELARTEPGALYHPASYVPAPEGKSGITHLDSYLSDPYQYPPGFLLFPGLALAVSNDFLELRPLWFGVQLALFLLLAFWITLPVASARAWMLLGALMATPPVLVNFQVGQIHLLAIAGALAAMAAIDRGWTARGGVFLGFAAGSKLFPGILALCLCVQRRWRALGASVLFGLAGLGLALLWFGVQPLQAFVGTQLGDLAGGEAFAKFRASEGFVTENLSLASIPAKVATVLAWPLDRLWNTAFQTAAYAWVLALAILAARRAPRGPEALGAWLAVLNATALASPYAPTDYVMAGVLWLVGLTVLLRVERGRAVLVAWGAWLFLLAAPVYPGLPILWRSPRLLALLGLCEQALAVGLCVLAVTAAGRQWDPSRRPGAVAPSKTAAPV